MTNRAMRRKLGFDIQSVLQHFDKEMEALLASHPVIEKAASQITIEEVTQEIKKTIKKIKNEIQEPEPVKVSFHAKKIN